jgi:hypothetical protein
MGVAHGFEAIIAGPSVRVHGAPALDRLLHKLHQAVGRGVWNPFHADASDPRPVFLSRYHY